MKIVFLLLNLMLAQLVSAQNYDQDMPKALNTWHEGNAAEAFAQFEKIAAANPEQWLPNYYASLINATSAFLVQDYNKAEALLQKAQIIMDGQLKKTPENAELLVVQALIYTAYLAKDPMMNGQLFYPKVSEIYAKAKAIAPENPRVAIEKASFELESAKYMGSDIKPICEDLQSAKQLLDTFKNEEPFYPTWGKEELEKAMVSCK